MSVEPLASGLNLPEEDDPRGLNEVKDRLLVMVRDARHRAGQTQADLALKLGISQPAVSMLLAKEKLGRDIPTDRLIKLLNLMGFDFALRPTEVDREGAIRLESALPIYERLNLPPWVLSEVKKSSLTLILGPNPRVSHGIMLSTVSYINRNRTKIAWTIERAFTQSIPNASQTSLEVVHQTYEDAIDFIWRNMVAQILAIAEPDDAPSLQATFEASYRCFTLATMCCDTVSHGLGQIVELLPTETPREARERLQDITQILFVNDNRAGPPEIVAIDCRSASAQELLLDGRFRELAASGINCTPDLFSQM